MQGLGWLAAIIVGGIAGWIASNIMNASTGVLVNILLGIVGAVLANAIFAMFGIYTQPGSWIAQGIAGLVGAIILIWLGRRLF